MTIRVGLLGGVCRSSDLKLILRMMIVIGGIDSCLGERLGMCIRLWV